MLVSFFVSMLCCLGYYKRIIKPVIVLEIYITQDVIGSNLVLIILTLYRSSVQTCCWEVSQILFGTET